MLRPAYEINKKSVGILILVSLLLSSLTLGCAQPSPTQAPAPSPTQKAKGWIADGVISEGEYTSHKSFANFEIYWKTDKEFLYMALKGKTEGWVAIGFEPTNAMKDADMVIGWVEDGNAKAVDAFSTGVFGPHPPDTELGGKNDLIEVGGKEENGITVVEFKRKLDTGDKFDKPLTPGKSIKIIWAMAKKDDLAQRHNVGKGEGEITI